METSVTTPMAFGVQIDLKNKKNKVGKVLIKYNVTIIWLTLFNTTFIKHSYNIT